MGKSISSHTNKYYKVIPKAEKGRATNLNPFDEDDLLGNNI
jgi:hypothetical protein